MYYRGTLKEFDIWHEAAKQAYGIPSDGIIGFVNGSPAPKNQRTIEYVSAIQNSDGMDDYIWPYEAYPNGNMIKLTQDDIEQLGWFVED